MKLILIAVGCKMPAWVNTAFNEYAKRMPPELKLVLHEIPPQKRGKHDRSAKEVEAKLILQAIPKQAYIVVLDERGKIYSSAQLADRVEYWKNLGTDVALLVGGPEGHTDEIRAMAREMWSLTNLTLPHPLVRVVIAEALYRAWSITAGLPYHRA